MKIVQIKWNDIITVSERMPLDIAKESELAECYTYGMLIFENDKKVIVAHSLQKVPQDMSPEIVEFVSEYSVIPKGCILEIKELSDTTAQ